MAHNKKESASFVAFVQFPAQHFGKLTTKPFVAITLVLFETEYSKDAGLS